MLVSERLRDTIAISVFLDESTRKKNFMNFEIKDKLKLDFLVPSVGLKVCELMEHISISNFLNEFMKFLENIV